MNIETAKSVISDNYTMKEKSVTKELRDNGSFSKDAFWEFYDSVVCLFKNGAHSVELTFYITSVYQQILKGIIFHFDPHDAADISDLPDNYTDYIDRLDGAVKAYLSGNGKYLDEKRFYLQR